MSCLVVSMVCSAAAITNPNNDYEQLNSILERGEHVRRRQLWRGYQLRADRRCSRPVRSKPVEPAITNYFGDGAGCRQRRRQRRRALAVYGSGGRLTRLSADTGLRSRFRRQLLPSGRFGNGSTASSPLFRTSRSNQDSGCSISDSAAHRESDGFGQTDLTSICRLRISQPHAEPDAIVHHSWRTFPPHVSFALEVEGSPVPEPSSFALLGVRLLVAASLRHLRIRSRPSVTTSRG